MVMKKKMRGVLLAAALLMGLAAGHGLAGSIGLRGDREVSAGAGRTEISQNMLHSDVVGWEMLMIGSGYAAWMAAAWDWKREYRHQEMEKREYVIQE